MDCRSQSAEAGGDSAIVIPVRYIRQRGIETDTQRFAIVHGVRISSSPDSPLIGA